MAAWNAQSLDADFRGVSFGVRPPDGKITLGDIDGFTSVYMAAVAQGRHLDPLPVLGGGPARSVTPLPLLNPAFHDADILAQAAGWLPLTQQAPLAASGTKDVFFTQGDEEPLDLLGVRRERPVAVASSDGSAVLRL
jgi:hypothetical protein